MSSALLYGAVMVDEQLHPALRRLLGDDVNLAAHGVVARDLSGADLTSLLLGALGERVAAVRASDVLQQYERDRFVAPASIDALALARVELDALAVSAAMFEPLRLAPLAPFGSHATLGATPQNNVVTTSRLTEVAADPTNMLALEAAVRRRALRRASPRSGTAVRLGAVSRVVRAQHFEGPRSFAHFSLLGQVSAGRDAGRFEFEHAEAVTHLQSLTAVVGAATGEPVVVRITAFDDRAASVVDQVASAVTSDVVSCEVWPEREHGRDYYRSVAFKVFATVEGEEFELGDGGDVWWTQDLLHDRKERLMISGIGLDRLAMASA